MFEPNRPRPARLNSFDANARRVEPLGSLQRALSDAAKLPRETRLQRERLSMRFARKVKIGDRVFGSNEARESSESLV